MKLQSNICQVKVSALLSLITPFVALGFQFSISTNPERNFIEYTDSGQWSSQPNTPADIISIYNDATVVLDSSGEVDALRIGRSTDSGVLQINQTYDLGVARSILLQDGLLDLQAGSVTASSLIIGAKGLVRVDGGSLATPLATPQPDLWTERFAARDQTRWATNDAEIAQSIGKQWRRGNPSDVETQYRIFNSALDTGAVSTDIAQRAMLVSSSAKTLGDGFLISVKMQQDTDAPTAYMGLVFNYQPDGSYYLFRVSAQGSVQVLVYSRAKPPLFSTG